MCRFGLAIAGILLLGVAGCKEKTQTTTVVPTVTKVEVAKLQKRNFQHLVRVQGTAKPFAEVEVSSRTNGNLDALLVKEGDLVKKGQLLFQVDQKNLENSVAVAKQDLAVAEDMVRTAEAELHISRTKQEKAATDFRRAQRLIKVKAISTDSYEISQVNFKNAAAEVNKYESTLDYNRSKVQQQRIQLSIAQKNLDDSRVKAPFGGTVLAKYKEQDEYVSSGTPVLHLENAQPFSVSCLISAVYYGLIQPGKTVGRVLFDNYKLCQAKVSYRALFIDPLSRTFEIKFTLPCNMPMVSGTLCNIDLVLEDRTGFGVPADAVMLSKGGKYEIYVVRDNRAVAVPVTPGITSNGYTELRNCEKLLQETIVVSGQYFLNSGDQVKVVNSASEK